MAQDETQPSSTGSVPSAPPSQQPLLEPKPEKRGWRLHKWHLISIILVIVVIAQLVMYVNLNQSHESLLSKHEALQSDYNSLEAQYSSLESDYARLDARYDSLQARYNSLQEQHDAFVSDYDALKNSVNQRSQHEDATEFITPNDSSVKLKVTQITGGWSDPSNFNEFWSDVKAMYDWVVNNIDYRYDGFCPVLPDDPSSDINYSTEMWQFPNETLSEKKGDCEDMAILLASMILNYNEEEHWVECIEIEGSSGGHLAVQIPVSGDKITILDPAGKYYTSDYWGNIDNIDISTEIYDWLDYWKSELGSDVHVERVFSNSLDKSFSSTSEYVSWMYDR
jgi:chaperonin cofactor prefoldin